MSKEFAVKISDDDSSNSSFKQKFLTFIAFILFLLVLPLCFFGYICVRIARKLWLKVLIYQFPHVDFVEELTMRTLLDSQKNQGIMNVLLTVSGACQPLQIQKAIIDNIVEKRNRIGRLKYPKLRALLVSCWGNYAWKSPIYFNIQNHLIIGNTFFKGRQITDNNIQDYISDIISKYLPTHLPPWQIVVIPNISTKEQKYFILVRVHHLLIADTELLNLGDLLLLKKDDNHHSEVQSSTETERISVNNMTIDSMSSPLLNIVKYPKALSKLYELLCESLSNKWNEFISEYDPMESPKNLKPSGPSLFQSFAIFLIVIVQLIKDFVKTWSAKKNGSLGGIKFYWSIFKMEMNRRGISMQTLIKSTLNSFLTILWLPKFLYITYSINYFIFIKVPLFFYHELLAFLTLKNNSSNPDTYIAFLYTYMPLLTAAGSEIKYWSKIIYKTPISLINEIIFRQDNLEPHQLQTESLCGRKIVAWSEPIPKKNITNIALAAGVSETEILLTLTKNCLESYFFLSSLKMPEKILLTIRTISCDVLFTSSKLENSSGVLCLSIPMNKFNDESVGKEILTIKEEVKRVQENQTSIFLIGSKRAFILEALPSVIARIALNYWFRKFPVLLTDIIDTTEGKLQETQWGHKISSFLCWMPPQGNISMSLTLQRYGDAIRIGIMTDARLLPHHVNAVSNWKESCDRLITHFQLLDVD